MSAEIVRLIHSATAAEFQLVNSWALVFVWGMMMMVIVGVRSYAARMTYVA